MTGASLRTTAVAALAALVALGPLAACGGDSSSKASTPTTARSDTPVTAARPATVPGHAVGTRTAVFVDTTRSTPAAGGMPGAPSRTLQTAIFYPAIGDAGGADVKNAAPAPGTFPLIVFAHGLGGSTNDNIAFLHEWAQAGYVVAAPQFPLTKADAPGGGDTPEGRADILNEPGDVSFVIDQMLHLPPAAKTLQATIDPEAVGVAGRTAGAGTVIGVGYNSCCRNDKVKAVVSMAGGELPFPNGSFFTGPNPPLLLLHGDADTGSPIAMATKLFDDAKAPKYMVTLLGAGGPPFADDAQRIAVKASVDFFDGYLKKQSTALDHLVSDAQTNGIATLQHALP